MLTVPIFDKEIKGLDNLQKVANIVFNRGIMMSEKIKVEVFGIYDQAGVSGGCACGGACGPELKMGEMFEQLEEYVQESDIKDKVELQFIDVLDDDIADYADVSRAMESGFMIPLTAIDGKLRFHRGISNEMIYEAVNEKLTSQEEL